MRGAQAPLSYYTKEVHTIGVHINNCNNSFDDSDVIRHLDLL
jgi:hypothetical protein